MRGRRTETVALIILAGVATTSLALTLLAQGRNARRANGPAAALFVILARPTDHSIVLSVLSAVDIDARVEYGNGRGSYGEHTEPLACRAGVPAEFEIGSCSRTRVTSTGS